MGHVGVGADDVVRFGMTLKWSEFSKKYLYVKCI